MNNEDEVKKPEMDLEQIFEAEVAALEDPASFARDIDRGITYVAFDTWLKAIGVVQIRDPGPCPSPTE